MIDRGKVIKGLECCIAYDYKCNNCPYRDDGGAEGGCYSDKLKEDALAFLKAQEPRVMTLEELEDWEGAVFFEAYETDIYYALIENVEPTAGMDGEFAFINVAPGEHHMRIWGGEHYGSIWRCWTSRPTDEQREAIPWEE